jgi:uncharacterized protein (TIGR00730 family)
VKNEKIHVSLPNIEAYMEQTRSIAVFCGSRPGKNPVFMEHARQVGSLLAARGITVVYGGGRNGLMGAVADAAMNGGGKVVGILPERLAESEHRHDDITELLIVDTLHTRKKMLFERCESAIILPGGYGTLDEVFEMLTWNQLSLHDKRVFFLNSGGYYDDLIKHIHRMHEEDLLYLHPNEKITVLSDPAELTSYL